ncbi:hypothetical protein CEXT_598471 [Caerostris extrusa]|uniref:Uncharacterized protein n=1 Tax=Caerostris extrusa TaxID=172846 RepID=A0AAV4R8R7_CAEEX|nr:hypothetical protein CEXT_598471 [Caerostris extrusa]
MLWYNPFYQCISLFRLRPSVLQLQETTHPITEPLQGWTFRGAMRYGKRLLGYRPIRKRILNDSQEDSATEEIGQILE